MLYHFYKIKTNNFHKPFCVYSGYEEGYGDVFINMNGGFCPKDDDIEIIEDYGIHDKKTFIEKHRKEVYDYLIDDKSDLGWLSPFCEWFPCKYCQHEDLAEYYFGCDSVDLENNGWVKVYASHFAKGRPSYVETSKINFLQKEWLENHCVKPEESGEYIWSVHLGNAVKKLLY